MYIFTHKANNKLGEKEGTSSVCAYWGLFAQIVGSLFQNLFGEEGGKEAMLHESWKGWYMKGNWPALGNAVKW